VISQSIFSGVPAGDPGRHMGHEFQEFRKYPSGTLLGDEFDPSGTLAKMRPLGDEFNFEYDPSNPWPKY